MRHFIKKVVYEEETIVVLNLQCLEKRMEDRGRYPNPKNIKSVEESSKLVIISSSYVKLAPGY